LSAGVGVQYIVPAMLVFYGRREVAQFADITTNPHRSIFGKTLWIILICVWALISSMYQRLSLLFNT
jgi:hypothetical protein